MQDISLKELIEAGAHFGHQTRRWNPKMGEFLYGSKDGVHVFDLTKTKAQLEEALAFLTKSVKEGQTVVFVGTKKQAREKVEEVAKKTGTFFITERWLGGLLTNFTQIKRSTTKLADMKQKFEKGEYAEYTKKERLLLDREVKRLERFFGGVAELKDVPNILIVVDTKREAGAIREAKQMGVTTIGVVDSNCDPTLVDYAIPMNDDASKAIEYVLDLFAAAINDAKNVKTQKTKVAKKKSSKKETEVVDKKAEKKVKKTASSKK